MARKSRLVRINNVHIWTRYGDPVQSTVGYKLRCEAANLGEREKTARNGGTNSYILTHRLQRGSCACRGEGATLQQVFLVSCAM